MYIVNRIIHFMLFRPYGTAFIAKPKATNISCLPHGVYLCSQELPPDGNLHFRPPRFSLR